MSQEINVEKGYPMPKKYHPCVNKNSYPWDKMSIGDSFKVDVGDRKLSSVQTSLASSARQWAEYNGKKWVFSTRKISHKEVRIWRIK